MKLSTYTPSSRLRQYIRKYWILEIEEEEEDCPLTYPVLPFGSFELVFNVGQSEVLQGANPGKLSAQPYSFYSGHHTGTVTLCFKSSADIVGVSLQPWAGDSLFDIPADSFTNLSVDLEQLTLDDLLLCGLIECQDNQAVVSFLDQQLEKRILSGPIDSLVADIANLIIHNPDPDLLRDYIDSFTCSRRRIEQRFREAAGLTMGTFTRKARFHKAVRLLQNGHDHHLTAIGLEAGYYDQSHFIREFKIFSSQTPKSFIESRASGQDVASQLMMVE